MGKHLTSSGHPAVHFRDSNPGCMWGILQILDYHNLKKVFPHKKHHSGRHARYKRKATLHSHSISNHPQSGNAEAEPLLVRELSKNVSATGKSLPTSRKKGLHRSKEENSEGWSLNFNPGPQLQQVNSIPELESSDISVQCKAYGAMDATYYSSQNQAISEYALSMKKDEKEKEVGINRDVSYKFKEHTDVLEIFRVDKDLLLKFLRELDVGRRSSKQVSNTKARLTKSGSFPLATSSQKTSFSSSSLEHKQNEIWAFPKGEKLLAGTPVPKMFASNFGKDISYMKSMPVVSDHSMDEATEQKPGFSSSRSSQGLNHKGWNQLVLHRFKVIKQKIKQALMEFKKDEFQTPVEAIHNRTTKSRLPNKGKEVSQSSEEGLIAVYIDNRSSDDQTKASDYNPNKHEVHSIRRTSSLNESLDRYTHLFEQSFGKDIKWQNSMSKSSKLTNEDKIQMSGAPKLNRRNLSLPNLESLGFILHEAFCDINDTVISARNSVDHNRNAEADIIAQRKSVSLSVNKDKPLDPITETEIQEVVESNGKNVNFNPLSGIIVEENDEGISSDNKREDIHEQAVGDGSFPPEKEETDMTIDPSNDVMEVLETSLEDVTTSHAEGSKMNTGGSGIAELETNLPNTGNIYSLPGLLGGKNASATARGTSNSADYHFVIIDSDVEKDSNFKYVKQVLEYSGFMENEHNQKRRTIDQPLKPSLFVDLEGSLRQEIECPTGEISKPCDHQLIFNLVNEVLLEIYERSTTYFPRPFSFNRRLYPMPMGHHLLKEVWIRVNSYLSLMPELDQTLDDVVGRDLAKNSGWMNLQWEEECVALELEEMIMEDLLDEVIFS